MLTNEPYCKVLPDILIVIMLYFTILLLLIFFYEINVALVSIRDFSQKPYQPQMFRV